MLAITVRQWSTARYKIKRFYGLKREITDAEIQAELDNLIRKKACGTMDNGQLRLYCELTTGNNPLNI